MSGCVRLSDLARAAAVALLATAAAAGAETGAGSGAGSGAETGAAAGTRAAGAAPARVVSVNLCTDQLAMLLAGPGQLHAVSYLAADPGSSAMADEAAGYGHTRGRAEEVFLMRPDLVLAGRFTDRATVSMLRRLRVPVVVMDPAYSLADVRARIAEAGAALGREAEAARLVAAFDAHLAALAAPRQGRDRAAVYYANGYTSGARSLAGDILDAAGFDNVAAALGIRVGGHLPLERLALSDPDLLVTGRRYRGAARAEEILDHPVIDALRAGRRSRTVADRDWICGTPHVLRAVDRLAAERAP